MMERKEEFLTVAPFQCAWPKDLQFREAGRGCVAFEAFAHNDVTLVFRETAGSQHYHYRRDSSPHYTVILGSHRNRRLKIEVDGNTVVDAEGIGLCTSKFQSYWISIYDGLISIGKGRYPFQNLVFQWLDTNPKCNVRYIGLSSWDKHVGYRNVNVLPVTQNHITLWEHVTYSEHDVDEDGDEELGGEGMDYENWGLQNFLESWELSDVVFIVGTEERPVPAHKAILIASGNFPLSSSSDVVSLPRFSYSVVHALLQYIYTGWAKISEAELGSLRDLSLQFEVLPLVKQCEETVERLKLNKMVFESGKTVELHYPSTQPNCSGIFPYRLPVDMKRLRQLHSTGEYSDVSIYIDGHGLVARTHKIVLSSWSIPFAKMFTNGMKESTSCEVILRDLPAEVFEIMLEFMYFGELSADVKAGSGAKLLQLFLLADQFGVTALHQECCKLLLECLSEDSVCSVLQVVSSIPSCRLIEETCLRKFAKHFDYCTTANNDFILLDEMVFSSIIKHPDLTVTSEEKVLNAILMFGMKAKVLCGWEMISELMIDSSPELLFGERLKTVYELLPLVRFPLLPYALLKKFQDSSISRRIPIFQDLVNEAINYIEYGIAKSEKGETFEHRRSSYKQLQYICDGDSNGILYFAGTSYGEHQWVNPVLAKRIQIIASSPNSRFTDPKVLASRMYQGTSFAGPRMDDGNTCAWWLVDLGKDHQLMCNYYTLRQDGSMAYMRYWNLQGSLDGITWTNLRVHENDQTICKPGQFASWPITGSCALLPFRFFRVLLTGPTVNAANPWNLCICYLELYGYFL